MTARYDRLEALLNEKKITGYQLCKETGLMRQMVSAWKAGEYSPKVDKVKVIADYFGVSLDYFYEQEAAECVKE